MTTLQSLETRNAIYGRRAIRRYKPETLSRAAIEELIGAAIQAPSAMNVQPWRFAIIEGAARLFQYSERAKRHLLEMADGPFPQATPLLGAGVNIFHGAPALVVICATPPTVQAAEDCCLAAQNLMLTAFADGLGTCPIGFARPWLARDETKRELGIPQRWTPVFPVVVGIPDEEPAGHGRSPAEIVWL